MDGQVDDGLLIGGLAAASAAAPFLPGPLGRIASRGVNAIARPLQRAFARPTISKEAVSTSPLSSMQSDALFNAARARSGHPYASRPVERGTGAWMGESGIETNPLYMTPAPRTMGRVDQHKGALSYAADMGKLLNQQAVGISRGIPNVRNISSGSNALIVEPVNEQVMRQLVEALGQDVVVAQQPGGKALLFPMADTPVEEIATKVNVAVPQARVRYAVSDPGVDRMLVGDVPYADMSYDKAGARSGLGALSEELMREVLEARPQP